MVVPNFHWHDGGYEYMRLEDLLHGAYQDSFPNGKETVKMAMNETYRKYVDRFIDSEDSKRGLFQV